MTTDMSPHEGSARIAARHLLKYQGFDDPNEMFEAAFRALMNAADRMVQAKVIEAEGECDASIGVDPRVVLRVLVDDYGGRRVRAWLDEIIELVEGEEED